MTVPSSPPVPPRPLPPQPPIPAQDHHEPPRPERILAADLPDLLASPGLPQQVRIAGWIHRIRALSQVAFLLVRDRTGLVQVVVRDGELLAYLHTLGEETPVEVTGRPVAAHQGPGGVELLDPQVRALSDPAEAPVTELWRPALTGSLPVLLDHAATTWRHRSWQARWRIAAAALAGFRGTLDRLGFTEVATPKIVGTSTESGANVFALDYFGRPAYLAQSPQFYKQTLVGAFERVYEVGPVFRAEPHDTVRHLAEYVSLDVEFGFIEDHRDVLAMLHRTLAGMLEAVQATAGRDEAVAAALAAAGPSPRLPESIPVIHFADALAMLGADPDEPDLSPAHERALGDWALAEHGSDFVAVEGYPMVKRPFYTHPQPGDPRWSNSFDLLFRGLELVTGGQRLHRHADYRAALAARGEPEAEYLAYLQAFAHGMPPHGGFAIGLERFVARLTCVDNVREVTLFPRDLRRLSP